MEKELEAYRSLVKLEVKLQNQSMVADLKGKIKELEEKHDEMFRTYVQPVEEELNALKKEMLARSYIKFE